MRLVAYLRVSTEAQLDGLGLGVQKQAIKEWAHGKHRIARKWCVDEGVSGTLAERPGLSQALEMLGEADGIVVARLDRIARDLVVQETILRQVWETGGQVFSCSAAEADYLRDGADHTRALIRQVLGAVAQYDRAQIRQRLEAGRRHKAETGGYAGGRPPLGMKAEGGELVPESTELRAIERVVQLRGEGRSYREIAAALTAEGYRPKRGELWYPMTARRIAERATAA